VPARVDKAQCHVKGHVLSYHRGSGIPQLWWDQLVTSPLWAEELSFGIDYRQKDIDSTKTTNKLSTQRVSRFSLSLVVMLSQ
jgi:hypothetical protein